MLGERVKLLALSLLLFAVAPAASADDWRTQRAERQVGLALGDYATVLTGCDGFIPNLVDNSLPAIRTLFGEFWNKREPEFRTILGSPDIAQSKQQVRDAIDAGRFQLADYQQTCNEDLALTRKALVEAVKDYRSATSSR